MATRLPHSFALSGRHLPAGIVLATGLVATTISYLSARTISENQASLRFDLLARGETEKLERRMDSNLSALRSIAGLGGALGRVPTKEEFQAEIETIEPQHSFPGIQAIGWADAVSPGDLASHEPAMRRSGLPSYRVWPAGPRDFYSSIVLVEPLDERNERSLGFDMLSDPARRAAMFEARDTGQAVGSAKVDAVDVAGAVRDTSCAVYFPVYRSKAPPVTLTDRRARFLGWVYSAFRAGDFFRETLGHAAYGTRLAVHDGDDMDPAHLLYESGWRKGPAFRENEQRFVVASQTFVLIFAASDEFMQPAERQLPRIVAVTGVAVAFLLFFITFRETQARARAEGTAVRNAILADAGHLLAASFDYPSTLADVVLLISGRVANGAAVYLDEGGDPLWVVAHEQRGLGEAATLALRGYRPSGKDAFGRSEPLNEGGAYLLLQRPDLELPPFGERPELAKVMKEARVRAALVVPLVAHGERLGFVLLVTSSRSRPFAAETISLAEDLARLVVSAVESARLYRQAQEAVRARDDFLSIASHELKTPITSLALQADSLRVSALRGDVESFGRKVEVVRRNVRRLASLVATMLDLSRIQAGRLEFEPEDVDLAEIAREVTIRFEDEAERGNTPLRVDAPEPVVGRWDRLRLDQVVTNLVSNAVKYGRGKPVTICVAARGDRAVLSVSDGGIGIDEADQPRIFERFERAVSDRHYSGFGLGLWIVREVVMAMGGEVQVHSSAGQGATFTVELDRRMAGIHADGPTRADASGPAGSPG